MATVMCWLDAAADADGDDDEVEVEVAVLAGVVLDDDELETEQPATRATVTGRAAHAASRSHRLADLAMMNVDISSSLSVTDSCFGRD